jgi:hypothetical protein
MFDLLFALAMGLSSAPPPGQDFDKDGVVDLEDDCPTDAGNAKNKGCPGEARPPPPPVEPGPAIEVQGNKLAIDDQIQFRSGSASVDPHQGPRRRCWSARAAGGS